MNWTWRAVSCQNPLHDRHSTPGLHSDLDHPHSFARNSRMRSSVTPETAGRPTVPLKQLKPRHNESLRVRKPTKGPPKLLTVLSENVEAKASIHAGCWHICDPRQRLMLSNLTNWEDYQRCLIIKQRFGPKETNRQRSPATLPMADLWPPTHGPSLAHGKSLDGDFDYWSHGPSFGANHARSNAPRKTRSMNPYE